MTRTDYRLFAALALSLSLHAIPFLPDFVFGQKFALTATPLIAELRPPPAPLAEAAQPPLSLPEQPRTAPPAKTEAKPHPAGKSTVKTWTQAVREHLQKLDKQGQFYPQEAIARGQEGEVLVLLVIDESGHVSAARVEQGSGHPMLDEAALRAVRSLNSLPADAPRQTLLPVRFRLK